jgi:hypothetical protein
MYGRKMKYEDIKVGMRLKLIRRKNNELYVGLEIGDIMKVRLSNHQWFELEKINDSTYCIPENLSYCWEPIEVSLKEFLE